MQTAALKEAPERNLVARAAKGDEVAFGELVQQHRSMLESVVRKFYWPNAGGDREDLYQEALIALWDAVNNYRDGRKSFAAFAYLCIQRRLVSVLRKAYRNKRQLNNLSLHLSQSCLHSDEKLTWGDIVPDTNPTPENTIYTRMVISDVIAVLQDSLSHNEWEVFIVRLQNPDSNYHELAEILDKDAKYVDNTLYRVRKKIKEAYPVAL